MQEGNAWRKLCCEPHPLSPREREGTYPLTANLVDAGMVTPTTEYVAPRVGGWKYPRAWMPSSLEGETRTRDQPVSRLAKLVPCDSLGSQSLPGQGRTNYASWERNRCVPIHPSWVLSNMASSRDKETPAAEEGGSSSQDKEIQVDRADRKALRRQESTHERMVSREHQRARAGTLPADGERG